MMRLLPMWEPWASMVAEGFKKVETRPKRTLYRGEVAIFATSKWDREIHEAMMDLSRHPAVAPFFVSHRMPLNHSGKIDTLRKIIAVVDLVDCERTVPGFTCVFDQYPELDTPSERAVGNYSAGRFGYVLDNPRRLVSPLPYTAHQGFYTLDEETEASVRMRL